MAGVTVIISVCAALTAVHSAAADETETAAGAVSVCRATTPTDGEKDVRVSRREAARLYRTTASYPGPCAAYGTAVPLGDGRLRMYAQLAGARPVSLGFVLDDRSLTSLPSAPTDGTICYDKDGNGVVEQLTECMHNHNYELTLPKRFVNKVGGPFTWGLVNWNPMGHDPEGIYTAPHFDFHFYLQDKAGRDAIRTGTCAQHGMIDCADYQRAKSPVPSRYLPPTYADFDAVVAKMGNHLIDATSPEFNGQPFTHTFMYGAYDGAVTFYEPMVAKSVLDGLVAGGAPVCTPIKTPEAWQAAGWYPTRYCFEHRANRHDVTVSLTDFVRRTAS
jgi:hypothetical protein